MAPSGSGAFFKQIMKRIYLFITTCLFIGIFSIPTFAKADDFIKNAQFIALPNEITAPADSLNASSDSFRVYIELSQAYKPDELRLYLDGCANPLDSRTTVDSPEYYLDSKESTLPELKILLGSCLKPVEGEHSLEVRGVTGSVETIIWQKIILADFTSPAGTFSAKSLNGSNLLKVGDKVDITYSTTDTNIKSVNGKIYSRDLTWTKVAGGFDAIYQIQEGDLDQVNVLPLNNLVATDNTNNITIYGNIDLVTTFSIDANSPTVQITNLDKTIYSTDHLNISYLASGYLVINFYLNDLAVNSLDLSNLTTGNYVVKIVATDLAGNTTTVEKAFSIDLVGPAVSTNSFPESITEGNSATLSGLSEPSSQIILYINSSVLKAVTDSNGKFSFELKDLGVGEYSLKLEAFDQFGNKTIINIGNFSVKSKPVVVEEREEVKVAMAKQTTSSSVSDISPEPVVAKAGRIVSSTDERVARNYTPWLILLGLLFFSFAISSAGYYGLSWLNLSKTSSSAQTVEISEETFESNISSRDLASEETKSEEDTPQQNLRW